jgi:broad specificity phosphatase PhoE
MGLLCILEATNDSINGNESPTRARHQTMIIYFVHSSSEDNELGLRSGWRDSPLSSVGQQQAIQLRAIVGDGDFDAVFSSDLSRASETARIVFPDADVRTDGRLREMNYGELNGSPASAFPDEHGYIENSFPSGESCLDVQARVQSFLNSKVPSNTTVAIFSHKYPQLALDVICNARTWSEALEEDWRNRGAWQPGWQYRVSA